MADRYWVGGTALWDGSALLKWAASSGGLGGQAVPTSTDDVFFDALSTGTCTIDTGATAAKSINCTGFTGTLAGTQALTVSGNITVVAGMTYTYTGILTLNATASITSAGKTFGPVTINGSGITVTLSDNLTLGTTRAFILTEGTLALNGNILSVGSFSLTGTTTKSIIFGSSSIDITGNGGNQLNMATATNFTYTGTPTFNLTYSGSVGTRNIRVGNTAGVTETNAPTINVSAGTDIISFSAFAKNVNFTGFSGTLSGLGVATVYGNLTISSGMTLTAGSNAITFAATSGTQQVTTNGKTLDFPITQTGVGGTVQLQDNLTMGSTRTFTLTNGAFNVNGKIFTTGIFSSSNSNTRTLNLGVSGKLAVNGGGYTATTTGLTFSGTGTISMNLATAKTFAGGGGVYPFTLNQGGAGTLTITGANTFADITNTVQPCTITFPASTTTTVSNFNVNGTASNLMTLNSSIPGTRFTLFKNTGNYAVTNYLSIIDSAATPADTWYALNSTDSGNNTGWIFNVLPPVSGQENPISLRSFTEYRRF